MSLILIYNMDGGREAKLKMLCRKFFIDTRTVEKSEYGLSLGCLLGTREEAQPRTGEDFDDEMLYISELPGGMLNLFLSQLRRNKLIIPLKAIRTETNEGFTSYELYSELCAEREAISKGSAAHKQ